MSPDEKFKKREIKQQEVRNKDKTFLWPFQKIKKKLGTKDFNFSRRMTITEISVKNCFTYKGGVQLLADALTAELRMMTLRTWFSCIFWSITRILNIVLYSFQSIYFQRRCLPSPPPPLIKIIHLQARKNHNRSPVASAYGHKMEREEGLGGRNSIGGKNKEEKIIPPCPLGTK